MFIGPCTNLSLQTVGKQLTVVRDALELIIGLSQLIQYFPKQTELFQSLQAQLSPAQSAPSLKPLYQTRWTVRTAAINSVLVNYSTLSDALGQIHRSGYDDYICCLKLEAILPYLMEKFSTLFGLRLSHLIFAATKQLSITLI